MPATLSPRKKRQKNPTAPPAADPTPEDIRQVPLNEVELDGFNHRLDGSTDNAKVADLAASMKANGQQQPVLVFQYPDGRTSTKGHRYLLAFGFRRCAAASFNEWQAVTAIVKPMPVTSDGTIDRLRIEQVRGIENLQRENLNPMEECILVQQLADNLPPQLDECGTVSRNEDGSLSEPAVRHLAYSIGRTEAWVRDRLYLDRLSPSVKQSVLDGRLYLIFAREIAKLADHDEQERVASFCQADPKDGHCPTTIHQVRRYVAERQNSLRGVPWQLDKEFPKHKLIVGPCQSCPFNSSNDKPLFEHDGVAAPEGFCLRTSCFEAKRLLAEKATKVAVAKIVKQELPPTESTAAQVTAEYVKPARVARQAKKEIEGVQPKKPKQRQDYTESPEYKARVAFGEAERKWREEADHQLTSSLRKAPGRLIALLLMAQTGLFRWGMTEKQIAKLHVLLKSTVKVTSGGLLQLEKSVLKQKGFQFDSVVGMNGKELLIQALGKLYGIELPNAPTLEQFLPQESGSDVVAEES
jgi:ParB/RepB/Spo0J family partition protein